MNSASHDGLGVGHARGQILPLFAISATVILALAGLGLDGARVFVERRQEQAAADLAALAGARSLPDDPAGAIAIAIANAAVNGYSISESDVITPYDGDTGKIKVNISGDVPLLLTSVVGMSDMDVSASAVAVHQAAVVGTQSTGISTAIFAGSADCSNSKVIDITSSFRSTGTWHTNATMNSTSPNNASHVGDHTYVCGVNIGDDQNADADGPVWDTDWASSSVEDWPIYLLPSDFHCEYPADSSGNYTGSFDTDFNIGNNGPWWVGGTSASLQLKAGTYCGRKLSLSKGGTSGEVTFLGSQQVSISAGSMNLSAHENNVVFAVMGAPGTEQDLSASADGCRTDAVRVSGSNGSWTGIIYVPCGRADVTGGGSFVYEGAIIANLVHVSGTDWDFNGIDVAGPGPGIESTPEVLALTE